MGRREPLIISILWYSFCNLAAGLSPSFMFLFVARALLGIGHGRGNGRPARHWRWNPGRHARADLMSGVLQGSWGLGFALSALAYGTLYVPLEKMGQGYGWRGMLILGVLSFALACVWIRIYVKEPEVWSENKKIQNTTNKQVTLPLFAIFKRKYLWNTFTGCLWMAANFCVYYSIWAMLGTYLTKELGWTPAQVSVPVFWEQHPDVRRVRLLGRGVGADRTALGAHHSLRDFASVRADPHLRTTDPTWFLMSLPGLRHLLRGREGALIIPGWLSERYPTEVRATAAGFVYHQGAIWGAAGRVRC